MKRAVIPALRLALALVAAPAAALAGESAKPIEHSVDLFPVALPVVSDGKVTFTAVEVGIAGQEYFEIVSGISVGDTVVAGPYQRIRQLSDGDAVRSSDGPVIN